MNAGPAAEIVLRRVREYGGTATSLDFAVQVLSMCQRIVNAGIARVIGSGTLTTKKSQHLYNYRIDLPDAVDIIAVKSGTRQLFKCTTLAELYALSTTWFRATGSRFEYFMQLGRDLLFLTPAMTADSSVTVIYSKLTTVFTSGIGNYNTAFELPDEDVDIALLLAEVILLLRSRRGLDVDLRIADLLSSLELHFTGNKQEAKK